MSNRLCKTSCWAPRICSPSVLTSDYENTIFPVAQAPKPWSHLWLLSSLHTQHLLNPEILLALTLKHIQNPTMSPILHCCYSCPSCHHFSSDDVKNLPAATLVLSTAFNPEKDSFFKYLSLVITMHRIVRPITCQALQGLTWSGPITSLTSFPTTLPIIHTTLHSTQPAVLNTPFMLLFQGFLSCIPSVGNLLALDSLMVHGSWLTLSLPSGISSHTIHCLRWPPHQNLQPHTQSRHSPVSFPCYVFLHSNHHLLTNYWFSVDGRSIGE